MAEQIQDILKAGLEKGGSDIFLIPGSPVCLKQGGQVSPITQERIMPDASAELIRQIYELARRDMDTLEACGDDDFSFSVKGLGRFRCNAYKQRSSLAAVLRIVTFGLPDSESMHIPQAVMDLHRTKNGMILVTGPAGSGKTTTLWSYYNH